MRVIRTLVMIVACASMACDSTSPLAAGIGTDGGSAASPNAVARVVIPAGALPANKIVTVEPVSTSVPPNPGLVTGAVYEFGPDGTTFNTPVTITIGYSPASIPANVPEASLKLYTQVGSDWVSVPGSTVDVNAHTVSGATTHFSRYAPLGTVAVAQVVVTPPAASVVAGAAIQLSAAARDASQNVLAGRSITWTSSDPTRATVSQSGLVSGIAVGTATITATSEGRSATVVIEVLPIPVATVSITPAAASVMVGATVSLSAATRDASGALLNERAVTWSSSDPSKATVSSTGTITGVAAGTTTILATSEGKSASATLTVTPIPISALTISPASSSLALGTSAGFVATAADMNGITLTGRAIAWSSSDPAIAAVSSSGIVTGVSTGVAMITATSEGRSATARVLVIIPVTSITISPTNPNVAVGALLPLTGTPRDINGILVAGRPIFWSTLNPSIATVSPIGVVAGVSPGTATIRATMDGTVSDVVVTVTNSAAVTSLVLTPVTTSVNIGGSTTLTATARDANNVVLVNPSITWTSSDPTKATVSSTGVVIGFQLGTVTIAATSNGVSATSNVTVVVPVLPVAFITLNPTSLTLLAGTSSAPIVPTLIDVNGTVLTGRTVLWSTSDASVATVSNTGVVTALAAGTANIIATSEGKINAAPVTVTGPPVAVPVATVSVTPPTQSVVVLGTVQLTAITRDASSNVLTGRTVSWTSSNTDDASVSATGLVTAKRASTVTITAFSEGKGGISVITITPIPIASVQVTPVNQSATIGGTIQLSAQTFDANNQSHGGRVITWTSSNTAVATVSATGLVTGVAAGSATITATSEGVSGSTGVTITAGTAPVFAVNVTPQSPSILVGATLLLTASPVDANSNALTGREITWSSSNTARATVSPNGLVTAVSAGTVTITATSEGKSGTTLITVTAPAVATVTLTPNPLSLAINAAGVLTATLRDANNNVLTGRTITWSSSATSIATVTTSGTVTGLSSGTATITATSEGKSGTATVNVALAPVATVTISPTLSNIAIGGTATLFATTDVASGSHVTGRAITWATSDASKATVSSTGVVTGVAVGSVTITATSEGKSGTTAVNIATVTPPITVATNLSAISTSSNHSCGLNTAGAAYCWGRNGSGQLGDNTTTNRLTPVAVAGGLTFASLSVDESFSCGLTTGGSLYCWGVGSALDPTFAPRAMAPGITFASISAAETHTCGVTTDGTGYCMGGNGSGKLGSGHSLNALTASPTMLQVGGGLRWKQLMVDNNRTCGIASTGSLYCWGSLETYENPPAIPSLISTPILISSAVNFASLTHRGSQCGLDESGAAYCVSGTTTVPPRIGGAKTFKKLSQSRGTFCGIGTDDVLYCWGNNDRGQLGQGNGGPATSTTPLVVAPGRTFSTVDIQPFGGVCAVATDGGGFCWGDNGSGQYGDGTTVSRNVPTAAASGLVFRVP